MRRRPLLVVVLALAGTAGACDYETTDIDGVADCVAEVRADADLDTDDRAGAFEDCVAEHDFSCRAAGGAEGAVRECRRQVSEGGFEIIINPFPTG